MKRSMKVVVLGLMVCGFVTAAQAQDVNSFVELLRKDIRAEKTAVLTAPSMMSRWWLAAAKASGL